MRLKALLLSLVLLVVCAFSVQARIGENLEECIKRYGPPERTEGSQPKILPGSEIYTFRKGGLQILAEFVENRVCIIAFSRDATRSSISRPLSETQIWELLRPNGGDRQWTRVPTSSLLSRWTTEDGSLIADYKNSSLLIYTADAAKKTKRDPRFTETELDFSGF